jgi:hypothetical protein
VFDQVHGVGKAGVLPAFGLGVPAGGVRMHHHAHAQVLKKAGIAGNDRAIAPAESPLHKVRRFMVKFGG